jgi:hypothetical protein
MKMMVFGCFRVGSTPKQVMLHVEGDATHLRAAYSSLITVGTEEGFSSDICSPFSDTFQYEFVPSYFQPFSRKNLLLMVFHQFLTTFEPLKREKLA